MNTVFLCLNYSYFLRLEEEMYDLRKRLESHIEGLPKFSVLHQTQQKLSFIDKLLDVFGLNCEERSRLKANQTEVEELLNSVEDEIEGLEEELDNGELDPKTVKEFEDQFLEAQKQRKDNIEMKEHLKNSLDV